LACSAPGQQTCQLAREDFCLKNWAFDINGFGYNMGDFLTIDSCHPVVRSSQGVRIMHPCLWDAESGASGQAFCFIPGTNVLIFKNIFAEKFSKKWRFLLETKLNYAYLIFIITLVFEKNANFSPKIVENRRKL
jgi:hypothetical protein